MAKIEKIKSEIKGDDIGSLYVVWDMEVEQQEVLTHPDDWNTSYRDVRSVDKIREVHYNVVDKVSTDITRLVLTNKPVYRVIEDMLLQWADEWSVLGLETEAYLNQEVNA